MTKKVNFQPIHNLPKFPGLSSTMLQYEYFPHRNWFTHCLWKMYICLLTVLGKTLSFLFINLTYFSHLLQEVFSDRSTWIMSTGFPCPQVSSWVWTMKSSGSRSIAKPRSIYFLNISCVPSSSCRYSLSSKIQTECKCIIQSHTFSSRARTRT